MLIFGTGLVAGSLHVISGPDHLAALAPIAATDGRRAKRLGALWGLGHGLGVCALGCLGLYARSWLDVEWLSAWSEFVVGIVLIFVGLWAMRRAFSFTIHTHDHQHENEGVHGHIHMHLGAEHNESEHRHHQHAAFGVGMLHGAAGTGHLFGVLPALALSPSQSVVYLFAYLLAAVVSMSVFGGILGRIAVRGGQKIVQKLMLSSGGAAAMVGLAWTWTSWPLG